MARKQKMKDFKFSQEQFPGLDQAPAVLKDFREKSWKVYQQQSFPSLKDEAWRRTSLRDLHLEEFDLANGQADRTAEDRSGMILDQDKLQGKSAAVVTSAGVEVNLSSAAADQGVIFTDLETAAGKHPQLLEKALGKIVQAEDGKFAAAAGAFSRQGLFVYVPKNTVVDEELWAVFNSAGAQTAQFSHLVIYLEEGSSLTLIQESHSPDLSEGQALTAENTEIFVGKNAHFKMLELQTYSQQMWSFGHKKALVERDGNLDWVIAALGGHLTKHFVTVDLAGKGAEGRISGLFFANQNQHMSYNTLQRHLAPRTISDLLFKGALTDSSRSVWRGMIYVAPGAQYIDGYQANRNLILSQQARSDSIPGLEILNNDVRCTHGSTVGKMDEEQLFYLQSRGIPRSEAEKIIIQGFFTSILSRIELEDIQEDLWEAVQEKIPA